MKKNLLDQMSKVFNQYHYMCRCMDEGDENHCDTVVSHEMHSLFLQMIVLKKMMENMK